MRFESIGNILCAASLLISALHATPAAAQAGFSITPLRYFGDDEGAPARGTLPADAGLLASVGLVRELGNRAVAVYDPKQKRIVVFDSSGKVVRHIGRQGRGPGEFTNVLSMDYDAGRLAVYDYSLARVTIFDTTGRVLKTVPTGSVNHIVLRGDSIWGAIRGARTRALWSQAITDDASKRVEMLPVTTPNPAFNPPNTGAFYLLARDQNGGALIAHDLPGLWYSVGSSSGIGPLRGRDLFPGAKHWVANGIATSPGQIDGIVGLGPNWVGLLVLQRNRERKPGEELPPRRLALFERAGQFLTYVPFPDPPLRTVATSSRPQEFYYVSSEPYYRVVLARLEAVRR